MYTVPGSYLPRTWGNPTHRAAVTCPSAQAIQDASPLQRLGIVSGVLRTFASVGMVFSFTIAVLVAAHSVSRGTAFAIFVGTAKLHGQLAASFTGGLHAAFYTMTAIMALAALLSATRARIAGAHPAGNDLSTPPERASLRALCVLPA